MMSAHNIAPPTPTMNIIADTPDGKFFFLGFTRTLSSSHTILTHIHTDICHLLFTFFSLLLCTGDATNTIVVGSHLDSVLAGPGLNDNGSGSTSNLGGSSFTF